MKHSPLHLFTLWFAAATFGGLAWRVTGFTLGHSATLVAGFYGRWVDDLVMLAVCGFIVVWGTHLCIGTWGQSLDTLPWLPVGLTYAALPIGRLFTALFERGAQRVVLACTETPLGLVLVGAAQLPLCVDATVALADACIQWSARNT